MQLSNAQYRDVLRLIAAWRLEPGMQRSCPVCAADGLAIDDRSARPHAEWYHVRCPACRLDETINIPLAPPRTD